MNKEIDSYKNTRKKYVDDFKASVYGNDWLELKEIQLHFDPHNQFVSGALYPQETMHDSEKFGSDDEDEAFDELPDEEQEILLQKSSDSHNKAGSETEDEGEDDELNVVNLSSQSRQSAFGLTFISELGANVEVTYGYSNYVIEKILGDEDGPKLQNRWNRVQILEKVDFKDIKGTTSERINMGFVQISIKSRKFKDHVISTVSMANIDEEVCLFECGIQVSLDVGSFIPIKVPLQSSENQAAKSLDLLFRNKLSFSAGKGCATDWEERDDLTCKKVWTDFVPIHEVKSIDPAEGNYQMDVLADIDGTVGRDSRTEPLNNLIMDYEEWIEGKKQESKTLQDTHIETASSHIQKAEMYLNRIKEGVKLVSEDEEIANIFRLTNFAMLIQFNRLKFLEGKNPEEDLKGLEENKELLENLQKGNHEALEAKWRPFQLAFILAVIPEMIYPKKYPELRDEVDLIWFPTGGGKTEAYLGLLAFTILHRRYKDPNDAGVTSIMRYTLRLLTADQFRRSAALICALDYIRENKTLSIELGEKQISLGLWIGGEASPKTHKEAKRWMSNPRQLDNDGNYRFILNECPWCKSNLSQPEHKAYKKFKNKVVIQCPDKNCNFNETIPVYIWEESVFEEKPSLILATVDNFAKLVWYEDALKVFSNEEYSPPDLIIQDELHLISGPLGSMVGLYENVVLKLLSTNDCSPKIVGASATLTFSDSQTKALYRGRSSNIFPPQVLEWGDSFFAKESNDKPGRLYMGYFGSSRGSMIESSTAAILPLLQSPQQNLPVLIKLAKKGSTEITVNTLGPLSVERGFTISHKLGDKKFEQTTYRIEAISGEEGGFVIKLNEALKNDIEQNESIRYIQRNENEESLDPYGTIIWYFNSKRELAYMSNQKNRLNGLLRTDSIKINLGKLGPEVAPRRFSRRLEEIRELTGRLSQDEIQTIVKELNEPWRQFDDYNIWFRGIDILFATNMISVGIDIPRLGLMAVHGQPRTTAEYIQATSRVGRTYPGLVTTIYNHTKSKDRSIYESFKNYHQSFYRFVESVSVTPFSSGARSKALAAIFIAIVRSQGKENPALNVSDDKKLEIARNWILDSVARVDPEEFDETKKDLKKIIKEWKNRQPNEWGKMGGRNSENVRLLSASSNTSSELEIFKAPISLRNSDMQVQIKLHNPDYGEEDGE